MSALWTGFIPVCECGIRHQQLMVEKVVVVKNKYQLHFTTICTAASGPNQGPPYPPITAALIEPLHW